MVSLSNHERTVTGEPSLGPRRCGRPAMSGDGWSAVSDEEGTAHAGPERCGTVVRNRRLTLMCDVSMMPGNRDT